MLQRRRSDLAGKRNPIRDAIATHAYERFLARGSQHGHDLDDWLGAEREFVSLQTESLDPRLEAPTLLGTLDGRAAAGARLAAIPLPS